MASLFNLLFSLRGGAWCFLLYSLWQLSASSANCFEAETDRRDRGDENDQGDECLRGKMQRDVSQLPPAPICLVPVTLWLLQGSNAHTISTLMQPDKQHEQELLWFHSQLQPSVPVLKPTLKNKKVLPLHCFHLSVTCLLADEQTHTHTPSVGQPLLRGTNIQTVSTHLSSPS